MSDSTEPADRRPLDSRSFPWVQNLAKTLTAKGIKPNQISLLGIAFAVVGFVMLYCAGRYSFFPLWALLAVVCIQGRLLCNLLDGLVAVEGGQKSKGGELFNEIPDRFEDALFFIGAGYAGAEAGPWCAALAIITAYIRAFGASLGHGQDFGGPCAKQHRMFFLSIVLILTAVLHFIRPSFAHFYFFPYAMWAIALGTAYTAWLRIQRLYQKMP